MILLFSVGTDRIRTNVKVCTAAPSLGLHLHESSRIWKCSRLQSPFQKLRQNFSTWARAGWYPNSCSTRCPDTGAARQLQTGPATLWTLFHLWATLLHPSRLALGSSLIITPAKKDMQITHLSTVPPPHWTCMSNSEVSQSVLPYLSVISTASSAFLPFSSSVSHQTIWQTLDEVNLKFELCEFPKKSSASRASFFGRLSHAFAQNFLKSQSKTPLSRLFHTMGRPGFALSTPPVPKLDQHICLSCWDCLFAPHNPFLTSANHQLFLISYIWNW